jgi:SAM-dependent methyltransferase
MRPVVLDFARDVVENLPVRGPVLEVGSRPAAGQEHMLVRPLFGDAEYVGCDIQEGPNVDRVEDVHRLSFADGSFNTVVALEVLEHVADPLRAVEEMHRVLAPGGFCVISSVMFFPVHEHPWDYWRFTPEGFDLVLRPFETRLVAALGFAVLPEDVFGIGVKGPLAGLELSRLPRTDRAVRTWGQDMPIGLGPIRFTVGGLWRFTARETAAVARRRLRRQSM